MPSITFRAVEQPEDDPKLECLNTTFASDCIYGVALTDDGVTWDLVPVPQFTKGYDLSDWRDEDRLGDRGWVATVADVDRPWRHRGIARALFALAEEARRAAGARLMWWRFAAAMRPPLGHTGRWGFGWWGWTQPSTCILQP
jgi:GNAT superfamily N-acetyltransferase